jgi:hypothetical protein
MIAVAATTTPAAQPGCKLSNAPPPPRTFSVYQGNER